MKQKEKKELIDILVKISESMFDNSEKDICPLGLSKELNNDAKKLLEVERTLRTEWKIKL